MLKKYWGDMRVINISWTMATRLICITKFEEIRVALTKEKEK